MHLAGELFREAILNAEEQHRKDFLKLIKKELRELIETDVFKTTSRNVYRVKADFPVIPKDAVYNCNIPCFLNKEERETFSVLFQAVRFYGLLHDLGHPPFSHVTESALATLFEKVKDKKQPTKREKAFLKILYSYSTGPDQKQLHEIASTDLVKEVFEKVINTTEGEVAKFRLLIQLVVLHIIDIKSPFLGLMHNLVDGDLDADRLDFTSRDLVSTGLGKSLGHERIVNTFTLCQDKKQQFHLLPSIRSLYSIETFFSSRFDLYRFGVFHHRVRKFDGLFKEAIMGVASAHLERKEAPTIPKDNLLTKDISGLWHVLSYACKSNAPDKVAEYYSQWDDAWLLNILRQEYFSGNPGQILKAQLEEILSNKKHYWPLFKRPECFATVDAEFLKYGKKMFVDNDDFWKSFKATSQERMAELRTLAEGYTIPPSSSLPSEFFLTILIQEMVDVAAQFVRSAIARLWNDPGLHLDHAFFVEKVLKSGIKDLKVLTEEGPQDIGKVSNIQLALETDAKLFPPFFVFILPKPGSDPNINLIRKRFGKYLFEEFERQLTLKASN